MESFFLSETLKYLYLLFDENNVLHTTVKDHVLTTQGHVFPLSARFRKAWSPDPAGDENRDSDGEAKMHERQDMSCPRQSMYTILGRL